MSEQRYAFDPATGDHTLTFTEVVPPFWVRRDMLIQIVAVPAILFVVLATIAGHGDVALPVLVIAGLIVFFCGGWNHNFPCTVTANQNSGQVTVASEFRRRSGGWRERKPLTFDLDEIASVERSGYADEYPDTIAQWSRSDDGTARSNLAAARNAWVVRVVFADGQEVNAAWQEGQNKAAALQKNMLDLFSKARHVHAEQRARHSQRAAMALMGDVPL